MHAFMIATGKPSNCCGRKVVFKSLMEGKEEEEEEEVASTLSRRQEEQQFAEKPFPSM